MLKKINKYIVILFLLSFSLKAQNVNFDRDTVSVITTKEFRTQLDDIFNDPNFASATWGVYIQSVKTGEVLYKLNQDKLFIPASLTKLFTSSASLLLLGSDYQFKTKILTDGKIENNSLKGNLIVQGVGDPTISGRFNRNNLLQIFESWADSLLERDIYEITGNLIGDDNSFDEIRFGKGWEYSYLDKWFASTTGALSFNENLVEMKIVGTEFDKSARISIKPDTRYITILNKVITGVKKSDPIIEINRNSTTRKLIVEGKVAEKDSIIFHYPIQLPTDYFMFVLKEILERKGIKVRGYSTDIDYEISVDTTKRTELFLHNSVKLSNMILEMNKNSNNFFAEQLLKTLGYELNEYGTSENGIKSIKNLLEVMGINSESMIIADGSGLSRLNLVTPKQIAKLLSYLYISDEYSSFYKSLPIGGKDGTLANRLKRTRAENNVRAKTGNLPGVVSAAGYITSLDNEEFVFCIMVNNYLVPSSIAINLIDNVFTRLSNFKRK